MHKVFLMGELNEEKYKFLFLDEDRYKHDDYIKICQSSEVLASPISEFQNFSKTSENMFYPKDLIRCDATVGKTFCKLQYEYTLWDLLDLLLSEETYIVYKGVKHLLEDIVYSIQSDSLYLTTGECLFNLKDMYKERYSIEVQTSSRNVDEIQKFQGVMHVQQQGTYITFTVKPTYCKCTWSYDYCLLRFGIAELEYIIDYYLYCMMCSLGSDIGLWFLQQVNGLSCSQLSRASKSIEELFGPRSSFKLQCVLPVEQDIKELFKRNSKQIYTKIKESENDEIQVLEYLFDLVGNSNLYFTYFLKAFIYMLSLDFAVPDYENKICEEYYSTGQKYALQIYAYHIALLSCPRLNIPNSINLLDGSFFCRKE